MNNDGVEGSEEVQDVADIFDDAHKEVVLSGKHQDEGGEAQATAAGDVILTQVPATVLNDEHDGKHDDSQRSDDGDGDRGSHAVLLGGILRRQAKRSHKRDVEAEDAKPDEDAPQAWPTVIRWFGCSRVFEPVIYQRTSDGGTYNPEGVPRYTRTRVAQALGYD